MREIFIIDEYDLNHDLITIEYCVQILFFVFFEYNILLTIGF